MKINHFLCGVIEGYYGRPWSFNQRKTLFEYCLRFGLNTYVYAPKDDLKRRSRWRDLYTNEELNELSQLINLSKQLDIKFIYALSPALDINYSSEKDLNSLKTKFNQLLNIGCENWSLLFDDIENEMSTEDKKHFSSFGHAQVALTNELYHYLNKPNIFIFCPTEFCSQMAKPTVEKSDYLQTIGNGLHPDIDVFWTGPKVVSRCIRVSDILSVNGVLKRRVTIWDNLNANDYDQRRLCLGPFCGRSSKLSSEICGILTNPNSEFELNFIPLTTLGQWFRSLKLNENVERSNVYNVEKAFDQSLIDWLPEFNKIKSANDSQEIFKIENFPQGMSPKCLISSLINDEDCLNENPNHRMEYDRNFDLTIDDIRLLVELFYLPYQNGFNVQQRFLDFYWLRFNSNSQKNLNDWHCRVLLFDNYTKRVSRLFEKLICIDNRALLYDIYNYIHDINSTMDLCSKYLHWIDENEKYSLGFMSGDVEPWSTRGGLAGQFLNILPLGDFQSFIKPNLNLSSNIFVIRPINSDDQSSMYSLTTTISYQDDLDDLLNQHSQILAEKIIGGYLLSLSNKFDLCFGINNNEDQFCGFVLTINESEKYDKVIQRKWIEQLYQKYPNVDQNLFELIECPQWIYNQYSVRIQFFIDLTIEIENIIHLGNKLMKIIVKNLIKKGCHGCHAILDKTNILLHQFYFHLGFVDIQNIDNFIILAKQF